MTVIIFDWWENEKCFLFLFLQFKIIIWVYTLWKQFKQHRVHRVEIKNIYTNTCISVLKPNVILLSIKTHFFNSLIVLYLHIHSCRGKNDKLCISWEAEKQFSTIFTCVMCDQFRLFPPGPKRREEGKETLG